MNWLKVANNQSIDGRIKAAVRQSPFFRKLFQHYGINMRDLWEIKFTTDKLAGQYAFTKGDEIILDSGLVKLPLEDIMHFVAHELSHWLTRKREKDHYFSDPEEVKGFEWAIAHEIKRGKPIDELERIFMPMIQKQIKGPAAAKTFLHMVAKAKKLC